MSVLKKVDRIVTVLAAFVLYGIVSLNAAPSFHEVLRFRFVLSVPVKRACALCFTSLSQNLSEPGRPHGVAIVCIVRHHVLLRLKFRSSYTGLEII